MASISDLVGSSMDRLFNLDYLKIYLFENVEANKLPTSNSGL
jgi:hypothetical protein